MPRENQSELQRKIYPIIVGKNFAVEVSYMEKMKYKMSSRATILLGRESVWGDRIFEKCGIGRDERGDGGKTLEIRGKRRLPAWDGGANYQQS